MSTESIERPRVVILGGGFGGIGAARELKKVDADVVVVDAHDYHTFQPLLYQVATDALARTEVGHALRDLFHDQPNARVHQATVKEIDLDTRQVQFEDMEPLSYDYLVLALGARVNFFGTEGATEHAFPMYTLADAVRLKEHILERWEAADRDPSLIEDGALNVVVVGGGPTGVESAGALAELYEAVFTKDYPDILREHAQITLVEASPEIFAMFEPKLREYAKEALEERGVEVVNGEIVSSVAPTRVTLKSGRELQAHTLIWGAGLQASRSRPRSGWRSREASAFRRSRTSRSQATPRCSPSATSRGPLTRRRGTCSPSSARSRCKRARVPERTSRGSWQASRPSPSSTTTRAPWRRSDAAPP
jgi:NADH dehydrogenase